MIQIELGSRLRANAATTTREGAFGGTTTQNTGAVTTALDVAPALRIYQIISSSTINFTLHILICGTRPFAA